MADFFVGLDLGQAADWTAIGVIERNREGGSEPSFGLRHLERPPQGTSYPDIVSRVKTLMTTPELERHSTLVVDATGVGAPVVDLLRQAGLSPVAVTITGGDAVSHEGRSYRVPKRDLVSSLQVLLQSGRLRVAEGLPLAQVLVQELLNFKVKITTDAHDIYGAWREGTHDDLVLAVALACWYAQGGAGRSGAVWMEYMKQEAARLAAQEKAPEPHG